jgi:hypothetical protein
MLSHDPIMFARPGLPPSSTAEVTQMPVRVPNEAKNSKKLLIGKIFSRK